MGNPLIEVQRFGQSIWYDNIRRGLITSGELQAMLNQDGLLGVTSNPSIFEKAIAGSADYDPATKALVAQGVKNANDIYERLAVEDIQLAADVLYPTYLRTGGADGFVSFEVSPHLARDTQGTVGEARRLRNALARDNVMIKVPATPEGIAAIPTLLADGLNLNITLLFAVETYEAVANAYIAGLERLSAKGGDLSKVASVASFFISRIDSLIDEELSKALDATQDPDRRAKLKGLVGKVAIANAKLAYLRSHELYAGAKWKALAAKGARPQRLLWASTSTKNPKYPKTLYVDELIGPATVNTIPAETFAEFRSSGRVRPSLTEGLEDARVTMTTLAELGISMKQATDALLTDGLKKFSEAFDKLLAAVERKREALLGKGIARQKYALGEAAPAVDAVLTDWRVNGKIRRLWNGDATIWSGTDEDKWLGWLTVVASQHEHADRLKRIASDSKQAGFQHVLLIGMGGSSLCPWVLRQTFGAVPGYPELVVLDSIVPAQVRAAEKQIDLAKTLFIVSSKSGGTTEPNVLKQYFFEKVKQAVGADRGGSRFIAITDPKTKMHEIAKQDRFRHIVHGLPSIGGRYSALSNFGIIPAAVMGLDVLKFLESTEIMVQACASFVPPEANPGVMLGAAMGALALRGRDKVTIIASPAIGTLGTWLEQLLAESTGKQGKGLVPVDDERLGPPGAYGTDRFFVYVRLNSSPSAEQDAAIDALEKAGHPVARITLEDPIEIGQEFFCWEIATAVAGSVLGINAFNQPDVEAAKIATRTLTGEYEKSGSLPPEKPVLSEGGIGLFADPRNADALKATAKSQTVEAYLREHLARIKPGDYFAINAYVERTPEIQALLQEIRHAVRDAKRVATTLGYGPRFLHSTGQLHKGGPNTGVFLQITSDDAADLPIPGQKYSFGILKRAQARGDFEVLAERGRRLLRIHLGADVRAGLAALRDSIRRILK